MRVQKRLDELEKLLIPDDEFHVFYLVDGVFYLDDPVGGAQAVDAREVESCSGQVVIIERSEAI